MQKRKEKKKWKRIWRRSEKKGKRNSINGNGKKQWKKDIGKCISSVSVVY